MDDPDFSGNRIQLIVSGTLVLLAPSEPRSVGGTVVGGDFLVMVLSVFVLGLIVLSMRLLAAAPSRCDECGAWFAVMHVDDDLVKTKKTRKTVQRTDEIDGYGLSGGYYWGTVKRREQIVVIRRFYHRNYRCRCCGSLTYEVYTEDEEL